MQQHQRKATMCEWIGKCSFPQRPVCFWFNGVRFGYCAKQDVLETKNYNGRRFVKLFC